MLKKAQFISFAIAVILVVSCLGPGTIFDTTAPAEVTAVLAVLGLNKVTLSWTNPADEDLDHVEECQDIMV